MNSNRQRLHALPTIYMIYIMLCLALLLAGCKPSEEPGLKAIVGAVLMDGTGGPPISDSVVTIEGSRIRAVGNRASLPVPADSDKIDGSGKFLVPGLIDLEAPLNKPGGRQGIEQNLNRYLSKGVTSVLSAGAGDLAAVRQAERQGGLLTTRVFILGRAATRPDVAELAGRNDAGNILDESRKFNIPVIADIFSLADARFALDNGAAGFLHMIRDTAAIRGAPATRTNTHWFAAGQLIKSQCPSGDQFTARTPAPASTCRSTGRDEAVLTTTTSRLPSTSASVRPSGDSAPSPAGAFRGIATAAIRPPFAP